jgi:dUTP pyrophosphatase
MGHLLEAKPSCKLQDFAASPFVLHNGTNNFLNFISIQLERLAASNLAIGIPSGKEFFQPVGLSTCDFRLSTFHRYTNKIMQVKIVNKSNHPLPEYATLGSAGMDLRANIEAPIVLQSLQRLIIPTGLYIELPIGYEAQIRPRSGMAFKKGISIPNAPGTIDSDYRGEIGVIIVNLSTRAVTIEPGERIAQMVIAKYEQISWKQVESLSDTERGAGGFGSTGKG